MRPLKSKRVLITRADGQCWISSTSQPFVYISVLVYDILPYRKCDEVVQFWPALNILRSTNKEKRI